MKQLKRLLLFFLLVFVSVSSFGQDGTVTMSQSDYNRLREILQTLEQSYQLKTQALDSSQQTIADLQKLVENGKKDLESSTALVEQLKQEIEDKKKFIEELQAQLLASKMDSAALNQTLASYQEILTSLEQQKKEISILLEKVSISLNEFINQADKKIASLQTQRNIAIGVVIVETAYIVFSHVFPAMP